MPAPGSVITQCRFERNISHGTRSSECVGNKKRTRTRHTWSEKRTCWKSHLATTHTHTHAGKTKLSQQQQQHNNNNNSGYLHRWQWQRATLLSHVTGVGRRGVEEEEKEGSVKYESFSQMGEKWWMRKLCSKCGPGLVPRSSLLAPHAPFSCDMRPLMRINFGLTFCCFVIVISVFGFRFYFFCLPTWKPNYGIEFPAVLTFHLLVSSWKSFQTRQVLVVRRKEVRAALGGVTDMAATYVCSSCQLSRQAQPRPAQSSPDCLI